MAEYAYKMTNADMTCTRGHGTFHYEPGVWYEEKEANCRQNGFHVALNPLDCLSYYPDFAHSQCWIVEIDGDFDEDDVDSKVSASRIRFLRRLSLPAFVQMACVYILEHPDLEYNNNVTVGHPGETNTNNFCIAVGENALARGKIGDVLGILRTFPGERQIEAATCFIVDGDKYKPGVYYNADGKEV